MKSKTERSLARPASVAILILLAAVLAIWWSRNDETPTEPTALPTSEETVADFYSSLAALDVEENERAARILEQRVLVETGEPALWANLAIAQLRLNEPDKASQSLHHALDLNVDSRELRLLNARILEYNGQIEAAIEQLRKLHHDWPENLSVTFSLSNLLGQIRSDSAESERHTLLKELVSRSPNNLRALCELARVSAAGEHQSDLLSVIDKLSRDQDQWPEPLRQQVAAADKAAEEGDFRQAALSITFFENLAKPQSEYQQSLAQLGMLSLGAVGTPLRSMQRLELPDVSAANADLQMTFKLQQPFGKAARPDLVMAMDHSGERRSTLLSLSENLIHADQSAALPFPGLSIDAVSTSLCVADLNSDFHLDLVSVGAQGCRIYTGSAEGDFNELSIELEDLNRSWLSAWAVDIDADGDLDLLLSDHQTSLTWIRNNGDDTFDAPEDFPEIEAVVELCQFDFDLDGDIDLVTLDQAGRLVTWQNNRNGQFVTSDFPTTTVRAGIAVGDIDRDGRFNLVSIDSTGTISVADWSNNRWSENPLEKWSLDESSLHPGEVMLAVADIDNNGGVDLITSSQFRSAIWLRTADASWAKLPQSPELHIASILDFDRDGLLDFVGRSETSPLIALNSSQKGYGWQSIEPRANSGAGDKRINSFGIGGRIEVRAGNLVQANAIDTPRVHFGLGQAKQAEIARIIWPNGTVQAEFDLESRQSFVANQRLKGSCPWVFTHDGSGFRFLKDFLWRSPLGLRINAQATAGVTQTEDWIKIPGDQLTAIDGRYQIRITAELWETHFFDHVTLLAIDHPIETAMFVDERFLPRGKPIQAPVITTTPRALAGMSDELENPLGDVLRSNDGRYADKFTLGQYQGVAQEHWVQFELPDQAPADDSVLIVGHAWIYPTDSSLNVALDQGSTERPFGLVLEQQHPDGHWVTLQNDLGFPAGKNKDVLIELPDDALALSRRFRLRTNMEVYWDSLRWCIRIDDTQPQVTKLKTATAKLCYRGYSELLPVDRRRPDTPLYQVIGRQQRWLDLEGFHTRFGDIDELLTSVDDRYAIVNAGDELQFEFESIADPPAGWQRDFVLVGDGWVKDGDFNTAFSQTVHPLPTHADPDYGGPLTSLPDDPVFKEHADDWRHYHTRFVTPKHLQQQLWRNHSPTLNQESQP
ncbi:FG-GAP-like repeat-containing protein [Stieleria sp. TO1_6]|uniref:FG-GAP-like repeat-containing protein n=1 Tax=Stieleria tagensis TaxID=2956795 RepID=UPI00209B93E9|nr:FG-GAP-like repeat-containing protein [Stieleria tagensis]MCO8123862.1 FG-GAP-like repeat-containing protein [Stieleria tagensis]